MARIIDYQNLIKPLSALLEKCLGNKIVNAFQRSDYMTGSDFLVFDLKSKEIFGNRLEVEINPFLAYEKKIEDIAYACVRKAIESLPRADRLERARLWNLPD